MAVRSSEGHPANDDDLVSEKGHLLAKRASEHIFATITGQGGCPPPPARYGPDNNVKTRSLLPKSNKLVDRTLVDAGPGWPVDLVGRI